MSARGGKPNATGRSSGKFGGRAGRVMKPPKGEPFIWLTREIIASDAWQSLTLNGRRFIEFLLIDHMNHAGRENGNLKATKSQLAAFGVTTHRIFDVITETVNVGLVDCHRHGMRTANTYTLTFYPLPDGTPPTNRWKQVQILNRKNQKSGPEKYPRLAPKSTPDSPNLAPKSTPDAGPEITPPSISRMRAAPNGQERE